MAGNSIGKALVLTTFGESHGPAVGGVLDGFPPRIPVDPAFIQAELDRRKSGTGPFASPRQEEDRIEILSGLYEGVSTGAPIAFLVYNRDQRPADYDRLKDAYRPSHADFTVQQKYGIRDPRGGGRSSARETLARVAGGAFARLLLLRAGINLTSGITQIGEMIFDGEIGSVSEATPGLVPYLEKIKAAGDTVGGIISCRITGVPAGLGEPVFDKLQADLAKAMLSINAVKGFEYGSGFAAASMTGSQHNDRFVNDGKRIRTATNHSGGIQGGISNGEDIVFRVAFKPVPTLLQDQQTVDSQGNTVTIHPGGRHDVCVVPRALPIVEAMAALVLADHWLRMKV
ncbi:MAG TPA: chorismate synthase [Bacteroidales bacterium]|nr:chorismate synthase [Bacteroidales bacterium]HPS61708.1 chorismate synthase [Bacteroidales bacterium]